MRAERVVRALVPSQALDVEGVLALERERSGLAHWRVVRRTIDARRKQVKVVLTLEGSAEVLPSRLVDPLVRRERKTDRQVVVVGAGPAGLFAALGLLAAGVTPIIVEQGAPFPGRHFQVRELRRHGKLLPPPAMTCGLGGAGTYSDGKLYTRRRGPHVERALAVFAWAAQDEEILIDSHPHVGSNRLPKVVARLRDLLEENGARFFFLTEAKGMEVRRGRVCGVRVRSGGTIRADAVVLAPGNNARGLFSRLRESGVALESKAFAVGVRVEHPRELIDRMQYGRYAGHKALGSARYSFALTIENRGVYSFCMCPGGYVLPTPPEEGHLCVNGMSFAPRSSAWSNAAVVVGVTPADWEGGPEPLSGVTFQRALERRFFAAGGRSYGAPAQRVTDFLAGRASADLPEGSYLPGTVASDVSGLLPRLVLGHLRAGLAAADRILKGYVTREAVVVGVESLTSTPLRMVRLPSGISTSHPGLFPCGEGSGYAGGLTSSAADGLLTAECVARWLAREGPA